MERGSGGEASERKQHDWQSRYRYSRGRPMKTRIHKWGNSLAVRTPKAFATEAGLDANSPVEISLVEGQLVIAPVAASPPTLDDLLAGITQENLHSEVD